MRLTYILRSALAAMLLLAAAPAAAAEDPIVNGGALCVTSIVPPEVAHECGVPFDIPDWVGGIQDCRGEPELVDCIQDVFREFWIEACLDRDDVNCAGVQCDVFLPYTVDVDSCEYETPTIPSCNPSEFDREVGVPEIWEEHNGPIGIRGYFVYVAGNCAGVDVEFGV